YPDDSCAVFFFNDTSITEIYTLSLHDALPIWLNDYKKAQQEAKASNKFLLLDFTGSDWCGWCKKFGKEILSQSQFKDYARENLRSEEHTSELQSRVDIVCRLLLEKKKKHKKRK